MILEVLRPFYLFNFNCSIFDSSDEFLTSLVYMDTSVNPNKLLGHVIIYEFDEKNAIYLDLGKFLFIVFILNSINQENILYKNVKI